MDHGMRFARRGILIHLNPHKGLNLDQIVEWDYTAGVLTVTFAVKNNAVAYAKQYYNEEGEALRQFLQEVSSSIYPSGDVPS